MDLVVKSRKIPLTEQFRKSAQGKVARFSRLEPRALRIAIDVLSPHSQRPHVHEDGGILRRGNTSGEQMEELQADQAAHDT